MGVLVTFFRSLVSTAPLADSGCRQNEKPRDGKPSRGFGYPAQLDCFLRVARRHTTKEVMAKHAMAATSK